MLKKWFAFLLVFLMSAQSLGMVLPAEGHHHVADQMHSFFHEVGQSHSHEPADDSQFEISYTQDAYEHSNPHQDGSVAGILYILGENFPDSPPGPQISATSCAWEAPFLSNISPPPKA